MVGIVPSIKGVQYRPHRCHVTYRKDVAHYDIKWGLYCAWRGHNIDHTDVMLLTAKTQ